jgi:hypothetical protein
MERLDAGRRPSVVVNVNGYEYRNTVGVTGGKHIVSISADEGPRHCSGCRPGRRCVLRLTLE